MSVEDRLRDGLRRSAATVEPDVRLRLPEAIARGKRRQRARQTVLTMVTVILVAGFAGAAYQLTRSPEHSDGAGVLATSGPYAAIAGTYTTTIGPASGVVQDNGMAGRWILRLDPNGVLTLVSPRSFRNLPTGSAFKIEGHRFTTDAFVNDPRCSNDVGVYRWQRSAARLTFAPISETCALRRTLFSDGQWRLSS